MSRTHKDRHKWKRKERDRTGESDPKKIKLHRERFLRHLEDRLFARDGYRRIVFRARLKYKVRAFETSILLKDEVLDSVPYLVENVQEIHHFFAKVGELDVKKEEATLAIRVSSLKARGFSCSLMIEHGDGFCRCESAFSCRFRYWDAERNLPECRM